MPAGSFLGLDPFRWIALITALFTLVLLADALAGHYRRGFEHIVQYAPFITGGALIVFALIAVAVPGRGWAGTALGVTGWIAVAAGLAGTGFHHYYGVLRKPGGYHLLLNRLMYGAPPLAPLALAAMGLFGVIASIGINGGAHVIGLPARPFLVGLIVACFIGSALQAGLLHFRGAFNNPFMYAPVSAPVLAAIAGIWLLAASGPWALAVFVALNWLTFVVGFVGLGMHLRGFDRQMGGLYVPVFNLLQGPPAWAPAIFSAVAAIGLVTTELLWP